MPEPAQHILITGGARSGKSEYAEAVVLKMSAQPFYISTCEIYDEEMRARIDQHRDRRGAAWQHLHAPLDLASALEGSDGTVRLVDCLTLWVNNLLFHERSWQDEFERLIDVLKSQNAPVVFVTNEVGMGIVPENAMARKFRDAAGLLNQKIAQEVKEVTLVVSGYPVKVK